MRDAKFQPGFRCSILDALVLALGFLGSVWFWSRAPWLGIVIAFVVGHFFFFCNVFRISRGLELCWAAVFTVATVATLKSTHPSWGTIALPSLLTAAIVIGLELRKPSYHGIGWSRINPGLREWWEANPGG